MIGPMILRDVGRSMGRTLHRRPPTMLGDVGLVELDGRLELAQCPLNRAGWRLSLTRPAAGLLARHLAAYAEGRPLGDGEAD